ncbi:MAG: MoxR family ATPase [Planctomycetaceae bacterium]
MNNSAISLDAGMQCIACGRLTRVNREQFGRRLKCKCGNIAVAQEHDLIPLAAKTSRLAVSQPPQAEVESGHSRLAGDQIAVIESLRDSFRNIAAHLSTVIVGQQSVIEEVLISIFCRGHVLLTGVPGLAKTLLIDSISKVLDLDFRRIQFTPDLMPADITGTEVLQEDRTTGTRNFQFVEGPIFSNMVLADEINRAPPKTQSALLEAMQERHVTVAGQTMELPSPFFVMATQNPIEQEGTYPLPEAQLDRFLFNCVVNYPEAADEFQIIKQATSGHKTTLPKLLNAEQIQKLQEAVRNVPAADHVITFARDLVQATRPGGGSAPGFIKEMVGWGAGPRAGISLIIAAKARAVLRGRLHATTSDVAAVALPVLRHRVVTTFHADAAGIQTDDVIRKLLEVIRPQKPGA